MIRHFILSFFLILPVLVLAQQPVQVTTILRAPYTLQLSDYYASTQEKLIVTLVNRDLNKPLLHVRLRMTIESQNVRLRSRDYAAIPPLQLEAGVPMRLSLGDLAPYFNPDNLEFTGLTRAQFLQEAKLPEGFYQFCFEAIEASTEQVASAKGCAMAWISLSDPPFLNLPRTGEAVAVRAVQNIIFQWTPRHLNSPNSAFMTEYDFQLAELWDSSLAPEIVFQSVPPLYEVTTRTTTLLYGPAQPLLIPGKRYGWRIRAHARNGVDDVDLFRNQGYSEIRWFTYQDACPAPAAIAVTPGQFGNLELSWAAASNHSGYIVSYKRKDKNDATWFDQQTSTPLAQLYDVEPGVEYEIRVGAFCATDQPVYGELITYKIPERNTDSYVNCSIVPAPDLSTREELELLNAGDVITAGDFPVKISEVSGHRAFTGKGYVTVPFLGKVRVRVTFENIHVNVKNQLIQGMVVTTADTDNPNIVDVDETIDLFRGYEGLVSRLKDFSPASDKDDLVQLVDKIKDQAKDELPPDTYKEVEKSLDELLDAKDAYDQARADNDALEYGNPQKEAAAKKVEEAAEKFNEIKNRFDGKDSQAVTSEPYTVAFKASPQGVYGFDAIDARYRPAYDRNYDYVQQGNEVAFIPWKAVPLGSLDWVDVYAATPGESLPGDVVFKSSTGSLQATPAPDGRSAALQVYSYAEGDKNEIVAYLKKEVDGKDVNVEVGKLNVVGYGKIRNRLVLIPVNIAPLSEKVNLQQLERALNAIYQPAVAEWTVQEESPATIDYDQGTHGLNDNTIGMFSNYTDEMEAIITGYQQTRKLDDDTYYLFLVETSESGTQMGYMPRKKQAGFIFMDKASGALAKTMAHELGHGAFRLLHTFETYSSLAEGTTDNLMDYAPSGVTLHKYQWDLIHNPEAILPIFDSEETGAYRSWTGLEGDVVPNITGYEKASKSFLSVAGIKITLPANARDFTFTNGYLTGFTISNERYIAMVSARVFKGYYFNATKNGSSYDISKARPYAQPGSYDATGKRIFYVLSSSITCGNFTIGSADYMSAVGEKNEGGIGMAADQYITRKVTEENVLLKNITTIGTLQSPMNCLTGRAKELFKFIDDHYTSHQIVLSEASKLDLVVQLLAVQAVTIKDLDAVPSGPQIPVKIREMLSYGAIEFLSNLKKAMAGGVAGKTLVVEFEDYNRMRDLYLVYQIAKKTDADCVIAEHLVDEIDKQIKQTGTVTFNLDFFTAAAKTSYEFATGNEAFELLSCLFKNLKVPESVYNPNRLDSDLRQYYSTLFARYLEKDPNNVLKDAPVGNYLFTCTCGVWNSVIDIAYGLSSTGAGLSQNPVELAGKVKDIFNIVTSKGAIPALTQAAWGMIKEHHGVVNGYGVDSYQATYGACYDVVAVASTFTTLGEVKLIAQAVRAGEAGQIPKILATAAVRHVRNTATSMKSVVNFVAGLRKTSTGAVDMRVPIMKLVAELPDKFSIKTIDDKNIAITTTLDQEVVRISENGFTILKPIDDFDVDPSRILYRVEVPWTDPRSKITGLLTLADDGKGGVGAFMHVDMSVFRNDPLVKEWNYEVIKYMTADQKERFNLDELTAVAMYTSPNKRNGEQFYQMVNRTLRDKSADAFYNAMIKAIMSAISKQPTYGGKMLYRGVNSGEAAWARTWKVGEVIDFPDFKSTSIDREYTKNRFAIGDRPVLYEISSPLAYDIRNLSTLQTEQEFLFKPGGRFKVLEIVKPTDEAEKLKDLLIIRLEFQWF